MFLILNKYKYQILIFLNLLWIWALIGSNTYYFDDNYRAAGGYYNWGGDYRPLADIFYYILGLGRRYTDISPLPQLLAFTFLYYMGYRLFKIFSEKDHQFIYIISFSNLLFCPFLLSNLYFRLDSVFMILALLLSVVSAELVIRKKYIIAIFLLFLCFGFYQPAVVGYTCFALMYIYRLQDIMVLRERFKEWIKNSLIFLGIFFISGFFYYIIIINLTTDYNFYSSTHTKMSFLNFATNLLNGLKVISVIFESDSGFIFFVIFLFLLFVNMFYFIINFKGVGFLIFSIINFCFLVVLINVNIFLENPKIEYRTFMSFGFYLLFLLISLNKILLVEDKSKKYGYIINSFIFFYFFSIALNVSNAQKMKNKFEDVLMMNLANDLYLTGVNPQSKFIFSGDVNLQSVDQIYYKYPVVKGLVSNNAYYTYKIQNYFPYPIQYSRFINNKAKDDTFKNNIKDFFIVKDSAFYIIYKYENNFGVFFKENPNIKNVGYND